MISDLLTNDDFIMVVGFVATGLTTISALPQTIKTLRTRSTKDISLVTYALLNIGLVVWFGYGLLLQQLPIIIGNSISLCFCVPILIITLLNRIKHQEVTG